MLRRVGFYVYRGSATNRVTNPLSFGAERVPNATEFFIQLRDQR
jgi:hypothetical protein